jgi:hypothetical protein
MKLPEGTDAIFSPEEEAAKAVEQSRIVNECNGWVQSAEGANVVDEMIRDFPIIRG